MAQRGSLILARVAPPDAGVQERYDRFGALTLLERIVNETGRCTSQTVVAPVGSPLAPSIRDKIGPNVTVAEACPDSSFPIGTMAQAQGLFTAAIDTVAVVTANLPYLGADHLAEIFEALPVDADGICLAEGERKHPLLGVYRRRLLERAQELDGDWDAGEEALWEGLHVQTMPAAILPGDNGGLTIASSLNSADDYRRALARLGFCDPEHPSITLEIFGNLRIRTGCGILPIRGDSVDTALRVFRGIYPEAYKWLPDNDELPDHFRFSINGGGVTTKLDHPLEDNDHLILFSATVGG